MALSRADIMAIRNANKKAAGTPGRHQRSSHAYTPEGSHVVKAQAPAQAPQGVGSLIDPSAWISQAVSGVHLVTAFPAIDYTYDPSAPGSDGQGSALADWWLKHVSRPRIDIQTPGGIVTMDPYKDEADYSGYVQVAAWGTGLAGAGWLAWTIYRAYFAGGR